jgi:hypothetical protein
VSQETQEAPVPAAVPPWFRTYWREATFVLVFLAVCVAIWTLGGCFDSNDNLIPDENRMTVGMLRDVISVLRTIGDVFLHRMPPA